MSGLPTSGFSTKDTEYIVLADADKFNNTLVNLIGVICSHRPPRKSNGTDFTASVVLCDPTRALLSTGLFVSFFKDTLKKLPDVRGEGDIMLLQNVKIYRKAQGEYSGISSTKTTWIIIPSVGELIPRFAGILRFSPQERDCCVGLREWWAARGGSNGARGIAQTEKPEEKRTRRVAEIREFEKDYFYDVMAYVVKKFYSASMLSLYITDYTENPNLYEYTKAEHADFPPGRLVLQCALWDANKEWVAQNVTEGQFIFIRNLRAKMSASGFIEGALHSDRWEPEKILIDKIAYNDPRLQRLKRRKAEVDVEQHRAEQLRKNQSIIEPAKEREKLIVSPHIVSKHEDVPVVSIGEVLNATNGDSFVNQKYRVRCRVIDFMPNSLNEFVVSDSSVYRWQFAVLLVDEQGGSLAAVVSDIEATELLGLLAEDVIHEYFFDSLKEKLFLLWGTMEEGGQESPWVELCLKEYGARESPAQLPKRRWKIFDTRIS